jgi:hypothetical protein
MKRTKIMRRAGITLVKAYTSNKRKPIEGYAHAINVIKRWTDDAQRLHSDDIRGIQKNPFIRSLPSLFKDSSHEGYLTSKRALATFSGLGRSVAPASKNDKVCHEAVDNHKRILSDSYKTDPKLLEELGTYVKERIKWIREIQGFIDRKRPNEPKLREDLGTWSTSFSLGACIENPLSKGGSWGYFRKKLNENVAVRPLIEMVNNMDRDPSTVDDPSFKAFAEELSTMSEEQMTEVANIKHEYYSQLWLNELENEIKVLSNGKVKQRVSVVCDKGHKARVVTVAQAGLVTQGSAINEFLIRILKNLGPCKQSLTGEPISPFLNRALEAGYNEPERELYSADLKSASDYIPHDVAKTVVKAIFNALREEDDCDLEEVQTWEDLSLILTGEMEVTYPDGSIIDTKRGILMGLPLTWPILSFINLFCANKAQDDNMKRTDKITAVCGDDLIGWWKPEDKYIYEDTINRLGLKINDTKTHKSKSGGVFTEQYIRLNFIKGSELPINPPELEARAEIERLGKKGMLMEKATKEGELKRKIDAQRKRDSLPHKFVVTGRPMLSAIFKGRSPPKGRFRDSFYDEVQPLSTTMGSMFSNEIKGIPIDQAQRVWYALRVIHNKTFGYMVRSKRPFFWPSELGGFGFRLPYKDYKRFKEPNPISKEDDVFARYASLSTANYWKHKDAEEDTRYAVNGNLSLDLQRRMKLILNGKSQNKEYLRTVKNAYAIADSKLRSKVTYRKPSGGRTCLKEAEQTILGGMLMVLSLNPDYDKRDNERIKLGNPHVVKRFVTRIVQKERPGTSWMKGVVNPLTAYKRIDNTQLYIKSEEMNVVRKEVRLGKVVQDYSDLRPLLSCWLGKCTTKNDESS